MLGQLRAEFRQAARIATASPLTGAQPVQVMYRLLRQMQQAVREHR